MKQSLKRSLVAGVCCFLLAGCQDYHQSSRAINSTQGFINYVDKKVKTEKPPVVVKNAFYIDTDPVSLKQPPKWLQKRVSLRAQAMPLGLLVDQLMRHTRMTANYEHGVNTGRLITLNYSGSIQGALDRIAAQTDYAYSIQGNQLNWDAFATKTFNISFMPGDASYLVGKTSGTSSVAEPNASVEQGDVSVVKGDLEGGQYSNLEAERLSIWNDLKSTLQELVSKQGKFWVSESTTSVTVFDKPQNLNAIAHYIAQLNKNMSREVSVRVQVVEVDLNKAFNYGLDWNLLQQILGTRVSLVGALGQATNISNLTTTQGLAQLTIGSSAGSHAILNAIATQGKVRVVTQPQVVTMNNQIASIRITRDTGYLKSVSTTNVPNSGTTTSLTPGVVTDGFTLYVLPKIMGHKIYMQVSSTISNLAQLVKVSNVPEDNSTENQADLQAIQVPTLDQKHFNQRTMLSSGATLVIAGFKQLRDETSDAKLFNVEQLGGKGAKQRNIETLVLITPVILSTART